MKSTKDIVAMSQQLSSEDYVHCTLMNLFKPAKPTDTGFKPSAVPSIVQHGHKKSLKLARKRETHSSSHQVPKTVKNLTVVNVPLDVFSVPKDKAKLRQTKRMSCLEVSSNNSVHNVQDKICIALP